MHTSLESRLVDLEARVAALEGAAPAETDDPIDGAVTFGGRVALGSGDYEYQWTRPTHFISDNAWDEQIARIAALAHPVRGEILRHLLSEPATAAELVAAELVSSPGTAYHHLKELQAAGWVTKTGGAYAIPPARVIPLMTVMIAAEAH